MFFVNVKMFQISKYHNRIAVVGALRNGPLTRVRERDVVYRGIVLTLTKTVRAYIPSDLSSSLPYKVWIGFAMSTYRSGDDRKRGRSAECTRHQAKIQEKEELHHQ